MPKLILSMDGLVLKEIPLDKERLTIGRKPNNDIQIDNLAISGQHAVITTILNDAFLEDRNSTNGTYVNGQPIKKHVLQSNDVVELGKYRLRYIVDSAQPGLSPSELVDTQALEPIMAPPEIESGSSRAGRSSQTQILSPGLRDAALSTTVGGVPVAVGVVQILSGANSGRELELTKSLTTLGKPGKQVAVITRRPHGYFITHVEGATFPLVNGRELDAQAHRLNEHDIIDIAGVKMEFFLR
ncbi:MAG TPA: FHA domain-containing protein [Rhodocyclaceae bacterium]|nr:FHA domain-containing protein [Zoogloeaceae bacterium]HRD33632.1 FHA domain-containing protein [Rhodocyclaceae bacterium]